MKCEDVQKELEAFLSNDIDNLKKSKIQKHLDECQDCLQALRKSKRLSEVLQAWQGIEPSPIMYEKLKTQMAAHESFHRRIFAGTYANKIALRFAEVAAIVVLTLLVSNWLRKPSPEIRDDLTTINFYLTEHQGAIAHTVSAESSEQSAAQIQMDRDDMLYYEFIDNLPEPARRGLILRGPSSQKTPIPREAPVISNRYTLTLAQARKAVNFDVVAPPRLHPGYILDNITKIEGRNALHLLYTNGINTVSLFEQPLEEKQGLAAQDFREYAVYRSKESTTGWLGGRSATILAWSSGAISFVLIGKVGMSQLMDMAQSINIKSSRR